MESVQQDKNCFLTLNVMAKQSERITFQVLNECSSTEAKVRKSAKFLLSTIVSSVLAFPCSSVSESFNFSFSYSFLQREE